MGVYVELRGDIECDRCGESYETIGYTVAALKKHMQHDYRWEFGKETLCYACALKKRDPFAEKGAGRDGV